MAFAIAVDAINLVADRRGMGRYVRGVLANWRDDPDLDVTLVVRDRASFAALAREFALPVVTVPGLRRRTVDAVWFPWNGMRFSARGVRTLTTMHDAFAFTYPHPGTVGRWREQRPMRRAVARSSALAAVSSWAASELAAALQQPSAKFAIVPPVPDAFWTPMPAPPDPRGGMPYVLVVGGPDERKNLGTLFSAFHTAFFGKQIRLIVAGNLRDEDERLLVRAGMPHARLRPSDERLRELYANALLVAVPSEAEGYGLTAVEAMACGAPVVAADAAALPQTCDGAALLVPSRDVIAWRDALVKVEADSSLRDDLRAKSLARVARIDPRSTAQLTLALLRRFP